VLSLNVSSGTRSGLFAEAVGDLQRDYIHPSSSANSS